MAPSNTRKKAIDVSFQMRSSEIVVTPLALIVKSHVTPAASNLWGAVSGSIAAQFC